MKIYKYLFIAGIVVLSTVIGGCSNTPVLVSDGNISVSSQQLEEIYDDSVINDNAGFSYVHISGAVNNPGVVELKSGSRLFEAVEKAGGFTEDASTDYCNLALIIADGEQYYIPTIFEASVMALNSSETKAVSHYDEAGRLNINVATKDELVKLPGIGDTRADAIISYRESTGVFAKAEDIKNVSGIKDNLYSQVADYIYVQ